jgi:spore coat polysaccharide biosynthesis protein SpsF
LKIGALIPIRLASERLPGKALMTISGRSVVAHLLDRVCACRHIENARDIVVCTTTAASDDPLADAVEAYGCSVFRGDIDDIIRRFADAMAAHKLSAVVQVDGDDPLSATEYMDLTMDRLLAEPDLDIVTSEGLPLGCNVKSFTRKAMDKVAAAYQTRQNDTGFIYFFTKSGLTKHVTIQPTSPTHRHDTARLTLDYPVDLEFFTRIFEALYRPGEIFGLPETVAFLRDNPELIDINRDVEAEYWRRTVEKSKLSFIGADGSEREIEG